MAQQHCTYTKPQTSTIQEHHNHLFHTPVYTHAIPDPTFTNQGSYPPYHTTPTYPYIHPTPPYTTQYIPQPPLIHNTSLLHFHHRSSIHNNLLLTHNTTLHDPSHPSFPCNITHHYHHSHRHTDTRARGNMPHQGQISKG